MSAESITKHHYLSDELLKQILHQHGDTISPRLRRVIIKELNRREQNRTVQTNDIQIDDKPIWKPRITKSKIKHRSGIRRIHGSTPKIPLFKKNQRKPKIIPKIRNTVLSKRNLRCRPSNSATQSVSTINMIHTVLSEKLATAKRKRKISYMKIYKGIAQRYFDNNRQKLKPRLKYIRKYIKQALQNGDLLPTTGSGLRGSFIVPKKFLEEHGSALQHRPSRITPKVASSEELCPKNSLPTISDKQEENVNEANEANESTQDLWYELRI